MSERWGGKRLVGKGGEVHGKPRFSVFRRFPEEGSLFLRAGGEKRGGRMATPSGEAAGRPGIRAF
ncbi:hypothetical protein HMPREF3038_02160 [Akkermansia sp. KLE1797]|nr:hypothetical protein HMPREF3038_02160 [Akkermansia sp. KLE1797]KXU53505.1 hypothetical protein HMPREF3039_02226 [Akkermansia sp. KLE1798]